MIKKKLGDQKNLGNQLESNGCSRFPVDASEDPAKGALADQVKHLVPVHDVNLNQPQL